MTSSEFQSTLPVRGATASPSDFPEKEPQFQSTLPVRGATDYAWRVIEEVGISIHAPRTGSDVGSLLPVHGQGYFNPRSPYGERLPATDRSRLLKLFQSTLPVRGATAVWTGDGCPGFISIHAPRTGSDDLPGDVVKPLSISIHAPRTGSDLAEADGFLWDVVISIHAPRTGSDPRFLRLFLRWYLFQSTLPVRGATYYSLCVPSATPYFNPRSPYGERRAAVLCLLAWIVFQSTLPVRGATMDMPMFPIRIVLQSTLPVRGATSFQTVTISPR